MNRAGYFASLSLLTLGLYASSLQAQVSAVLNSMNFQGRLAAPSGNPVPNGTYSIRFSLWNVASGGTAAANEKYNKTLAAVQVKNGTFAVTLDAFPATLFNGNLWLEIKIGSDAALTPRTPLVTVPYAFKAGSVVDGSITSASIANGTLNIADFPANFFNTTAWLLGGNSATNPAAQFLGTTDNQPLNLRINNRRALRITYVENIPAAFRTFNMLGGADANSIGAGVYGATIAGGGNAGNTDLPNIVNSDYGFLGGGYYNLISTNAVNSVLGGGFQNNINPGGSNSVIVGGEGNTISAAYAFIGGGQSNTASGANAFVGGGVLSGASGANSVVVGGYNNLASAQYSAVLGGNSNQATRTEATVSGGKLNRATGEQTTISGGENNVASAPYATISGGVNNIASLNSTAIGGGVHNQATGAVSFVGGGADNIAFGRTSVVAGGNANLAVGESSTIGGGDGNQTQSNFMTISGGSLNYGGGVCDYSTIGGGYSNSVYGNFATVPGGYSNSASGTASFAAGVYASAVHAGAFVWADDHTTVFASSAVNQFSIRAYGGMVFEANDSMPLYTSSTTGEKNRYVFLLNSPQTSSASGLKAGGILCADSYAYANPTKNNMIVKGKLSVGYNFSDVNYTAIFNGSIYANGSYSGSDARYKKNIASLDNALDSVLALRGVSYDWDKAKFPQQNFGQDHQMGFIAQEIEKIFPHLVMTAPDGYKAVNYVGVIPVLVEAVKTLKKDADAKQQQIDELKARLARLEHLLDGK